MSVGLKTPEHVLPIEGCAWVSTAAGIKKPGQRDLTVLQLPEQATIAGVFTTNAFAAAPVQLARKHLTNETPRAFVINSGNANAGTGEQGLADAKRICESVAQRFGLKPEQVLPFSTGVIGQRLPVEMMQKAIEQLSAPQGDGWLAAAQAIMTTDTVAKAASRTLTIVDEDGQDQTVCLSGIAKGSGMIRPNMATMLSFIATDAHIAKNHLQQALKRAVEVSFNSITVDSDTSTNDSCMLTASGTGPLLAPNKPGWTQFCQVLSSLSQELAQAIVRDAEGATRFITLDVSGAQSQAEARDVAYTVAHSPLVKTACFAGDPNWGRILAAVGRAPIKDLAINGIQIALDEVKLIENGEPAASYKEADGAKVMAQSEYTIYIQLGRGKSAARIWTSDLSYEYVRINAEYRS